MPSIDDNIFCWGKSYHWNDDGDEWSGAWGGTNYLWFGTIFPRILSFVPVKTILEIAPGYGRCTQYLINLCNNLQIVDLNQNCIERCKKRFSGFSSVNYHVNDGKTLEMITDESIDFVFSWDSLVHCESDVIESYIAEFSRILKPKGWGFIHHSNIGQYYDFSAKKLICENFHARGESMTAKLFKDYCDKNNLQCVSQEVINWGGEILNDSFSLFTKTDEKNKYQYNYYENEQFTLEIDRINKISKRYKKI